MRSHRTGRNASPFKIPGRSNMAVTPCWHCGHPDSHDETHARGCPTLPALSDAEVREVARACVRGWREDAQRKREE